MGLVVWLHGYRSGNHLTLAFGEISAPSQSRPACHPQARLLRRRLQEPSFSGKKLRIPSPLAIRGYLAGSMSEPALYETVEEFKARQPNLPREAEALLTDLNAAKYSKSTIAPEQARDFVARSKQCLKTIHAAHTVTS
jgi:hypothetical protein